MEYTAQVDYIEDCFISPWFLRMKLSIAPRQTVNSVLRSSMSRDEGKLRPIYYVQLTKSLKPIFLKKLIREDSSAKQLRYGAKKLVAKRQVIVGRKCLAARRDEERMNTLHNSRSVFAFFRLAKASVQRARNVVKRGKK